MAQKKVKKDPLRLVKKCITVASSILVGIFLFLETLVFKGEGNVLGFNFSNSNNPETISPFNFLFKEEYETLREELNLAAVILWIVIILVVVSIVLSALSLLVKKQGSMLAKVGGCLLVVSMVALFVVNLDKVTIDAGFLGSGELYLSNLTALYFVSLVTSLVGLGSSLTLKK